MSQDTERRQSVRKRMNGHVDIISEDSTFQAQITNISDGGMRLLSSVSLESKSKIELKYKNRRYKAIVHGCDKRYNGFALRVEFLEELT
jgi:c-di-GMP-binding flagellar brake protein YcgR